MAERIVDITEGWANWVTRGVRRIQPDSPPQANTLGGPLPLPPWEYATLDEDLEPGGSAAIHFRRKVNGEWRDDEEGTVHAPPFLPEAIPAEEIIRVSFYAPADEWHVVGYGYTCE